MDEDWTCPDCNGSGGDCVNGMCETCVGDGSIRPSWADYQDDDPYQPAWHMCRIYVPCLTCGRLVGLRQNSAGTYCSSACLFALDVAS
jgi:hypothetical protein